MNKSRDTIYAARSLRKTSTLKSTHVSAELSSVYRKLLRSAHSGCIATICYSHILNVVSCLEQWLQVNATSNCKCSSN